QLWWETHPEGCSAEGTKRAKSPSVPRLTAIGNRTESYPIQGPAAIRLRGSLPCFVPAATGDLTPGPQRQQGSSLNPCLRCGLFFRASLNLSSLLPRLRKSPHGARALWTSRGRITPCA